MATFENKKTTHLADGRSEQVSFGGRSQPGSRAVSPGLTI